MKHHFRWLARAGALLFAMALLYPFTAFFAPIGPWQWSGEVREPAMAAVRVSLVLTGWAMLLIVSIGTPIALYIAGCGPRERIAWQAVLLITVLLPPLALGILLALAFGPHGVVGAWLQRFGILTTNNASAFIYTQVYVGMGYFVLGAVAAVDAVPPLLQQQAALLGLTSWKIFWRVTLPLAKVGFAVAVSITWIRTVSEFGAVMITAYYPSGMPVRLWVSLQNFGLPAVMPLLIVFLAVSLPLPWLIHVLAQRPRHA